MIKKFIIKNFKSFNELELNLGNFCVFIGSNGSGKSNLVDALRFIRDSVKYDLNTAVNSRFGWRNVLNKNKRVTEKIEFYFDFNIQKVLKGIKLDNIEIHPKNFNYRLSINSKKNIPKVNLEVLNATWEFKGEEKIENFIRNSKEVRIKSELPHFKERRKEILKIHQKTEDKLFLTSGPFFIFSSMIISDFIKDANFFHIDVNSARQPSYDENIDSLAEDGSKLPLILNKLNSPEYEKEKKRINNLLSTLVPDFNFWKTERQFDGTLGFKIYERGIKSGFLPKIISDGTIRLLALLIAIIFQSKHSDLIAIDEPERCLHPQILKTLVEIMREVSQNTQIIITTHSTEIVKWLNPDELYLVDKINNSTVIIPAQKIDSVDSFLEDFSLDEMWLSGMLGKGNVL